MKQGLVTMKSMKEGQPVDYKGIRLNCGYRVDVLVENEIVIELKSVEQLLGSVRLPDALAADRVR